ncbi:DUF427 domain-containing protein [Euzebya tangerina]|uniref:DUF427 domain-containing protein n=1 Tax=Euzebya tangerina TaxID=591198 RepID=UPI000E30B736|nr:DUF427 domain-containing protein [Euzebya tangerina]
MVSNQDSRPTGASAAPGYYPTSPVEVGHIAPVPRRIRATWQDRVVLDTTRATYVWEHPYYPQFYIPSADVDAELLVDTGEVQQSDLGPVTIRSLVLGDQRVDRAARFLEQATVTGLDHTYRFEWSALDRWFEEDEEVFGHPRSPYVRVDALRSRRRVRVEKDGVLLAESTSPVAVFETGLPTRWYLDRTAVNWEHLVATDTQTRCPYKGLTSEYWSVVTPEGQYDDVVWSYNFPTRHLQPIAGLVAFYNEKVDLTVA